MKILQNVKKVLFPMLGILCVLFAGHITSALPYLLGGAMIFAGILRGISYFQNKYFLERQSDELTYGIVLFIMGIAFVIQGSNSLGALGTTWAIIGIRKASKSLNRVIRQIYEKKHFLIPLIEFLVRITLALVLLFYPDEKFTSHVVILGLEMIAVSVRFTKLFPSSLDAAAKKDF